MFFFSNLASPLVHFSLQNKRLEIDIRGGTIAAWINPSLHDCLKDYIVDRVIEAKNESGFARFTKTFRVGNNELILGLGGSVVEPMLGSDFKGRNSKLTLFWINLSPFCEFKM